METELSTVEIKPKAKHRYSVIWLHGLGLGGDGYSFKGIAEELNLKNRANIHFIFPHAPLQPLSINNGIKVRAWHDIVQIKGEPRADIDSIYQSAFLINQVIQKEILYKFVGRFFDICKQRDLTGTQGVIIPASTSII